MRTPVATLSGSFVDDLERDAKNAVDALFDAIRAVEKLSPHGRDFVNTDDYHGARRDHARVVNALSAIKTEVNQYYADLLGRDTEVKP